MKILSKRLKELRSEKGISQLQLAKIIGISQSVYCNYETGISEPTAHVIVKFADFFEVSADYLLGRKEY